MPDTIPKIRPVDLPKPEKRRGFTPRQVAAVFIRYDGRCAKCAWKVTPGGYHIDHITPLAALGKHELENWQLLCVECHKPKTKVDNAEAKKGARIRGEKGQRARRERNGPSLTGRSTFQSRGFDKSKSRGMDGRVRERATK